MLLEQQRKKGLNGTPECGLWVYGEPVDSGCMPFSAKSEGQRSIRFRMGHDT